MSLIHYLTGMTWAELIATLNSNEQALNVIGYTGEIKPYAGIDLPTGALWCDGGEYSRTTYSTLWGKLHKEIGTVTISNANPAVVTRTSHGFVTGDKIYFTSTGTLPTGLSQNTIYYVIYAAANTFNLATTLANALAGTKIATTSAGSGTHTVILCPWGNGNGTTTFNAPSLKGVGLMGKDPSQTEFAALGQTGGEKKHTLTIAEMPSHTHAVRTTWNSQAGVAAGSSYDLINSTSGSAGGDAPHNNLSPYAVVNYIIVS